jgi:hypothetical protein
VHALRARDATIFAGIVVLFAIGALVTAITLSRATSRRRAATTWRTRHSEGTRQTYGRPMHVARALRCMVID